MADFAPNYTARYRVKYLAAGIEHQMTIRVARGAVPATIISVGQGAAFAIANAYAPTLLADDFTWIEHYYSESDTDVFLSGGGTPTAVVGTVDFSTLSLQRRALQTTFHGRSAGSTTEVYLFGVLWDLNLASSPASNGRAYISESAPTANAILALNAADIVGADGTNAGFTNYANVKVNDYHLRQMRQSST